MRPAFGFLVSLGLALAAGSAQAAPSVIDPDPRSLTLGEILDREQRAVKPVAVQQTAPRRIVREPVVPREAVTVIVPGRRLRHPARPVRR